MDSREPPLPPSHHPHPHSHSLNNNNNNAGAGGPYDGSSPLRQCSGFNIDASSVSAKKKRGRPRKYFPDGNIALGLSPTPIPSSATNHGDSSGTPSSDPQPKKHRGRPPGSGKKQLDALAQPQHQQQNMMVGPPPPSYLTNNNNASPMINPNSGSTTMIPTSDASSVDAKKKRGRPRKYPTDGNIALGLSPTPIPSSPTNHGDSNGTLSSDPQPKRHRGRPPGSGKKQLDALDFKVSNPQNNSKMDSLEPPLPPSHHPHSHSHSHPHQSAQPQHQQQNMMVGPPPPPSYPSNNNNASPMISPNSGGATMIPTSAARFPFNAMVSNATQKPLDSLNNNNSNNNAGAGGPYDGSSPLRQCSDFNIDASSVSAKKKRGRPRKYFPDSNIALGLSPTPIPSSATNHGDSSGTPSSDPQPKKHRGRPPGSGMKQLDALGVGNKVNPVCSRSRKRSLPKIVRELIEMGSRKLDVKKSFKLALRSLLTSCSNQEFREAFAKFTNAEQQHLHRLFIQVITSLHENIEDEFESLCLETQVGATLDGVDQLVEEQSLDPLFSEKTNVMDVARNLSAEKKNEIQYLTSMLEMAEEENRLVRARVELLREGRQDVSSMADAFEKLRSWSSTYGTYNTNGIITV